MHFESTLSDGAVLTELGHRLARRRIDLSITQAALAEQAGVSKRTVERIEAGDSTQTATLIRILRVLGLLEGLDRLLPPTGPSPMDLLQLKGKERQRASSKVREEPPGAGKPWTWGEDTTP